MTGWHIAGAIAIAASACEAAAQTITLDIPAGSLSVAAERLAEQTGTNIVIADRVLWSRPVKRLRGRMTASQAIDQLARQSDAGVTRIGTLGWRLTRRREVFLSRSSDTNARSFEPAVASDIVVLGSKRGVPSHSLATAVERIGALKPANLAGSQSVLLASTVVSSTYRGPGRDKLFVRGIADSAFIGQTQSVTGLYFGDLRLSYGAADPDLQLHDMESVEILQGPQGSLYGSGSLAGVIRLNPRRPRMNRFEGATGGGMSLTMRGAPSVDGDAALNLPLGKRTAVRLVGYARQEGGYIDKPAIGTDVNRVRIGGGRADLRQMLGESWTVDAIVIGQSVSSRDAPYRTRETPGLASEAITTEPFASTFGAVHLVASGSIDNLELTSSTGLTTQRLKDRNDARTDTTSRSIIDSDRRDDLLLHETRVASSLPDGQGWVMGLGLTQSSQRLDRTITLEDGQVSTRIDNRVTEIAFYGDGAFRPWKPLLLGGGLRMAIVRSAARPEGDDFSQPGIRQKEVQTQGWLVPSLSALLRIATSASLFARYQQGFRPGVLVPLQGQIVDRLARDELRSIEGGARFDRERLSAEMSIIRSRWNSIQGDYVDGSGPAFTTNLGNGRILSLNAQTTWQASASVRIQSALTLNHSELRAAQTGLIPDTPDPPLPEEALVASSVAFPRLDRIPYIPSLIARLETHFRRLIGRQTTLELNGWVRHEGRSEGAFGTIRTATQGPVWMVGLSASLARGDTETRLSIDNLLNTRATRFGFGPSVGDGNLFAAPYRPFTARIGIRRSF